MKLSLMDYLLPIIGALIGWGTNFIAIKMLFHPHNEVRFLCFTFQGVIPKRQRELAKKIGEVISQELLSASDITEIISRKALSPEALDAISQHIERAIANRLPSIIPSIAMVLQPRLALKIRKALTQDAQALVAQLVERLSTDIKSDLKIHVMIEEKIAGFSIKSLETLTISVMKQELRFIEWVGAVLGGLTGVAQLVLSQL